jgi:hypothetical protein
MKSRKTGRMLSLLLVCLLAANAALCAEKKDPAGIGKRRTQSTRKRPAKKDTLAEKLSRRVSVDIEGETLENFIYGLSEQTEVNMVIDYVALEGRPEIRLPRYRLKDIPLRSALKAILRSVGLDFKASKHFVFISTTPRLSMHSFEPLETRVYKLDSAAMESLPKVALLNIAAAAQGNMGSIMQRMLPVNPGLVGGGAPAASGPAAAPAQPPQ